MKTAILALGLYKTSGGVNKSVRAFQKSIDAQVISWVDPLKIEHDPLIWDESIVVRGSRLPIFRNLLYPAYREVVKAKSIVAQSDLISCHSFWRWHNLWLRRVSKSLRVPYWFVPHGGLDPYVFQDGGQTKELFLRLGGTQFIREAACVVFSTRRERDKAAPWCPARRAEVIYWPLEDRDFAVVRTKPTGWSVRKKYGIPYDHRCLLYFGRLHPMKRPLETIDALAAANCADVHLLLVGNEYGISQSACQEHANIRGVADRVHLAGPVYGAAVTDYLSAADAYISLSWRENFNFTAAESMAAGLPVILSPGNDLTAELEGVTCGWMLKDDRIETAAQAIREAATLSEPALEDLGAKGSQWAREELSFETFQGRVQQLARTILSEYRASKMEK